MSTTTDTRVASLLFATLMVLSVAAVPGITGAATSSSTSTSTATTSKILDENSDFNGNYSFEDGTGQGWRVWHNNLDSGVTYGINNTNLAPDGSYGAYLDDDSGSGSGIGRLSTGVGYEVWDLSYKWYTKRNQTGGFSTEVNFGNVGGSKRAVKYHYYSGEYQLVVQDSNGNDVKVKNVSQIPNGTTMRIEASMNRSGGVKFTSYNGGSKLHSISYQFTSPTNGTVRIEQFIGGGGIAGDSVVDKISISGGKLRSVTGTVRDQSGDPVNNASVVAMAYYPNLSADVNKLRNRLQDVKPDVWKPKLELTGSDGKFAEANGSYAAVHTSDDWNLDRFQTDGPQILAGSGPDLDTPNLVVSTNNQLILTTWNAGQEGFAEDGVNSDLPGKTSSGQIVVQRIDAANQTLEEFTLNTTDFFETYYGPGTFVSPVRNTHEAAVIDGLPVGFYRIYPKANPAASYVIAVAPERNVNLMNRQPWVEGLKTKLGDLSARAEEFKNITNKNGVAIKTTRTDASGSFNFSFKKTPKSVSLKAVRRPEGMAASDFNGSYPSAGELKTYMDTQIEQARDDIESIKDQNLTVQNPACGDAAPEIGSAYLPANGPTVSPPAPSVDIEMKEVTSPNFLSTANQLCLQNSVRAQLLNSSLSGLLGRLNTSALSTAELRSLLTDLKKGMIDNPDVCKRWARNMGASGSQLDECESGTDENGDGTIGGTIPSDPGNAARETVEEAVNTAQETAENTRDTVEDGVPEVTSPEGNVSTNGENITVEYDTGMETVLPEDVFVRIHFSNGTTKIVSGNSSYVTIDERFGRSTVVRLEDYPLGDAASAEVEFSVFGSEGVASGSVTARNPTFQGTVPGLRAVRLSSTQPGPNDRVVIEAIPESASDFGKVTAIRVQGPNGPVNVSNVSNGQAAFTTDGAGTYRAELAFTNPGGKTFTEVVSISAGKNGVDRPPTIRGASGPTGLFAVVSDGFVGGSLQSSNAGKEVTARGFLASDADVPTSVHVYTQELEVQRGHTTRIQVLRAPDESQLSQRTGDVLHEPAISSDGFGYRKAQGESQALPQNDSGQYGTLKMQSNQTVVETFSDSTGAVGVKLVNSPGTLDTIAYETCLRVGVFCGGLPDPDLPDIPVGWSTPALDLTFLTLAGLVAGRRRWSA